MATILGTGLAELSNPASWLAANAGPLEQEDIDASRRISNEGLEPTRLTAVGAEVARVKKPPALGLDHERVRVEGAVIDEEWGNPEVAELERLSVTEEALWREICPRGAEVTCLPQDLRRRLTHVKRNVRMQLVGEPEVVRVAVGDDDPPQRCIAISEAGDRGQGHRLVHRCIDGPAHVEDEPLTPGVKFDAGAAELASPSVDTGTHAG